MTVPFAHVLVVEHDSVVALDQQRLLQDLGAEATIAGSGEQAMILVRQRRFDLIILSINLPGIIGLEVCRRLKQDPDLMAIPVLFMSGETSPYFVDIAFRLGAVDYLTKPCEPEYFKQRVSAQLPVPLRKAAPVSRACATP